MDLSRGVFHDECCELGLHHQPTTAELIPFEEEKAVKTLNVIAVFLVVPVCFLAFATAPVHGAHPTEVPAPMVRALLSAHWEEVADFGPSDPQAARSAPFRAVKAHAYLALNRNDESMALLATLANDADRAAWMQWASDLADRNPSNHVAQYLKGDAQARLGAWKDAVATYSEALTADSSFAMALNARGVAFAYLRDVGRSLADLKSACESGPAFADAFASLGTLLLLREAAEGALENYELALEHSDKFALAKNGRGCARLGYSTDSTSITEALTDFAAALECSSTRELAESNIESTRLAFVGTEVEEPADSAGTYLTTRELFNKSDEFLKNYFQNKPTWHINDVMREAARNQRWCDGVYDAFAGTRAKLGFEHKGLSALAEADLTKWEQKNRLDAQKWSQLHEMATQARDPAAGVDLVGVALGKSVGDMGRWPAKAMRFGLMPEIEPPDAIWAEEERREG
jgi:tetratricopeptide (TPR) repeat protein